MLETFGIIVVWATVILVALGCLLLVVVSTIGPHALQPKPKNTDAVERNTPSRT